jgi:hypothetical protein
MRWTQMQRAQSQREGIAPATTTGPQRKDVPAHNVNVHGWLVPVPYVHRISFVRLSVAAPEASRQRPDCTPTMAPDWSDRVAQATSPQPGLRGHGANAPGELDHRENPATFVIVGGCHRYFDEKGP